MNSATNRSNIKPIHTSFIVCPTCGHYAHYRIVEITDEILPVAKLESTVVCHVCTNKQSAEYDVMRNDYTLDINCTFRSKGDLRRRIYLNNDNKVSIHEFTGSLVFEFMSSDSYFDTLEILLTRALTMIEEMAEVDTVAVGKIKEMIETGEVKLKINDPTGYTRVYPADVTDIKGLEKEPISEVGAVEYTKKPRDE